MNQGFTSQQKQELVQIVTQVVDKSLDTKLEKKLEEKLKPTIDLALKPIKKDLSFLRKDLKRVINHFDKDNISLDKRILRVEQHLNLPPIQ